MKPMIKKCVYAILFVLLLAACSIEKDSVQQNTPELKLAFHVMELNELLQGDQVVTYKGKDITVQGFLRIDAQKEIYQLCNDEEDKEAGSIDISGQMIDPEVGSGSELLITIEIKENGDFEIKKLEVMHKVDNTKETDWFSVDQIIKNPTQFKDKTMTIEGNLPQALMVNKDGQAIAVVWNETMDEYLILNGNKVTIGGCKAWIRGTLKFIEDGIEINVLDFGEV